MWKVGLRIYTSSKYPALPNVCLTGETAIMSLSYILSDSVDFCFLYFEAMLLRAYKFSGGLTYFSLRKFSSFLGLCLALKPIASDIT